MKCDWCDGLPITQIIDKNGFIHKLCEKHRYAVNDDVMDGGDE